MRYSKMSLFLLVSVFLFCGQLHAQVSPEKDSMIVKKVGQLSQFYSLSTSQQAAFLSLERQNVQSTDSIGKLTLSPEQRKQWLAGHLLEHDRQLKNIMDAGQWEQYSQMLRDRRNAFLQQAAEKQIRVDTLSRN